MSVLTMIKKAFSSLFSFIPNDSNGFYFINSSPLCINHIISFCSSSLSSVYVCQCWYLFVYLFSFWFLLIEKKRNLREGELCNVFCFNSIVMLSLHTLTLTEMAKSSRYLHLINVRYEIFRVTTLDYQSVAIRRVI